MKIKYVVAAFMCFTFVFLVTQDAYSQSRKKRKRPAKDEYFDESGGFKHKLWYGGGLNLQLSGNTLLLGVSPMVGYKISDRFSVGPRAAINYIEGFSDGTNPRALFYGFGPFARAKLSEVIFAHVEYEFVGVSELNNRTIQQFAGTDNFFIGAGYNSLFGNGWGFEIMLLYNLQEDNQNTIPLEYRAGINYNF